MRKYRIICIYSIVLLLFSQIVFAAIPEIITTRVRQVAPGVIQRTLEAPSKPWMIYVLEMDINNSYLDLRAIDGGGLQKPSIMASAEENMNYRLVGATNGDFYEPDYTTTNAGVVDGKITKLEKLSDNPVYWSALSIGDNNIPTISCNKFEGEIVINGSQHEISEVNASIGTDELGFYNHYKGANTGNSSATEIRIQPLDAWKVNETMKCTMVTKSSAGNMGLGSGSAVLSGYGTAATYLNNNYTVGDTVDVLLEMKAFEDLSITGVSYNYLDLVKPLKHLIGGYPMFVRDGINYAITGYRNEGGGGSFATDLHPRTAAGYNADSTKMYFVVVDGRQTSSIGISLVDLADIMIDLGAWRAMNFDGGGSSAMVVDDGVINSPSDGVERSVRNCWAIYSTATEGDLSQIQIELDTMKIYRGQSFDFLASGWDDNYNPKNVSNWGNVEIYCDPAIGMIEGSDGSYAFTASQGGIVGHIFAKLNNVITDSMLVEPIELDPLIISPFNATIDTIKNLNYAVYGIKSNGDTINVSSEFLEFSVKDPEIGEINEEGVFTGKLAGSTTVYVHYGLQCDSTNVNVYVGEGECSIDPIETVDGWSISGVNLDTTNTQISTSARSDGVNGASAMKIDYKTTDNGKIYLSKDIEIPGVPEIIMLDVLSDGLNHRMYINLIDAAGNIHTVYQSGYVNNSDQYKTLFMDASEIDAVYPVRIKNIYIKLKTGIHEGTLYVDDLRMTYPGNTAIDYNENMRILPEDFKLYQSYPNPFNPSASIKYDLRKDAEIRLSIYNIRGEMVENLANKYQVAGTYQIEWTPGDRASACYFYKLEVGGQSKIGKMLFLK